ncbi:hypothetical protein F5B19DRAFT_391267 [Rostrohypoxylon terebratum]|nr:hypothetical protein F5B19DRAFT_391267 [Rostrohypoxylon terebratum]
MNSGHTIQRWKLVNVERSQWVFGEIHQVIPSLTVPNFKYQLSSESELNRTRKHNSSSYMVTLPQETFDDIITELSSPVDIISVALTCSYLWRRLLPQAKESIRKILAPWAGDHLVLISSRAMGVPESCVGCRTDTDSEEDIPYFINSNPLYNVEKRMPKPLLLEEIYGECADTQLLIRLWRTFKQHTGSKQPGVLRNLSKKQYVLDSKLAECKPEGTHTYCLGQALGVRAQWSYNLTFNGIQRGTNDWAGYRFDIRGIGDVPEDEGWSDVSEETIALLRNAAVPQGWLKKYEETDDVRSWV